MSAIAAWVSARRKPNRELLAAMLAVMGRRGTERAHVRINGGGGLAAGRFTWECSEGFAGAETVYQSDGLLVAADATLYYRKDLLRALGETTPAGGTVSHLIAAAYRKWGVDLPRHLEGDFSAIIWDSHEQRLVVFRDFSGCRPLFYAVNADRLAVASAAKALLQDPDVSDKLNLRVIATEASAFLDGAGPETSFHDVKVVPAGHTLVWTAEDGPRIHAHWTPPKWRRGRATPFEDAAQELRSLLIDASRERLSPHGVTCVSLSGGWDSPAVFGSAQEALRVSGLPGQILPVSMSYPEGDPGREDEFIQLIADRWNVPVTWIQAYDVPILDKPATAARRRDLPWSHLYGNWNRKLATEARNLDARVLMSGYGGDQLFQVSDIYLADLFRRLRWITLKREWDSKGFTGGFRNFFRWAIGPNMGSFSHELARIARRGKRLASYLDRKLPPWIRDDFAEQHHLVERERLHTPTRSIRSRAEAEIHWYLTEPFFPRVNSAVVEFALEAGVELRSPIYDARIVEFAATRPWSDRAHDRETKKLLRASVRGLVPDEVLAPRTHRTGITGGYAVHSVAETVAPVLADLLDEPLRLADLGIVEPGDLKKALERMLSNKHSGLEHPIFLTVQSELWLREHENSSSAQSGAALAGASSDSDARSGTLRV